MTTEYLTPEEEAERLRIHWSTLPADLERLAEMCCDEFQGRASREMARLRPVPVGTRSAAMKRADRASAAKLLRCAADLVIQGEPFPVLEAERRLGVGRTDDVRIIALAARDAVGGERTELQLLEAAALLDDGWSP